MPKTVKVAQTDDLAPGSGKVIEAEGQRIALFNIDGTYYAMDNTCTHRGGPLGEGQLNEDIVTCPWHGAQFDVKTGDVVGPPAGQNVRKFEVTVQGNEVFIELP